MISQEVLPPKRYFYVLILAGVFLSSCATRPVAPVMPAPASPVLMPAPGTVITAPREDIVHMVVPGETLYRLGKMYDVKPEAIMARNSLTSHESLRMGQKIVVPNAAPLKEVIPVFPSTKWKYIIIHHSATDEDDAMSLYRMHQRRGWDSTGYDFIIDNGSRETKSGHIDATPRWIAQKDGAHCKASDMNAKAIGICLVGNFSKEHLSDGQLRSLLHLVNYLRKYYNIPVRNILGHGQVPGAHTECPGTRFPWKRFWDRLSEEGTAP